MPVDPMKLKLSKSSDRQKMAPLDAGIRLLDAEHKSLLGKRLMEERDGGAEVMEELTGVNVPGIFFGSGSIAQISSPEHDPNLDISHAMEISESVPGVGERIASDDNDFDIVSELADEFLILFEAHLERAPFATKIIMTKQTAMYQGATTLRTSIIALRKFTEKN
jgi:hypothetical protein